MMKCGRLFQCALRPERILISAISKRFARTALRREKYPYFLGNIAIHKDKVANASCHNE